MMPDTECTVRFATHARTIDNVNRTGWQRQQDTRPATQPTFAGRLAAGVMRLIPTGKPATVQRGEV
jgi:hypothetical protein